MRVKAGFPKKYALILASVITIRYICGMKKLLYIATLLLVGCAGNTSHPLYAPNAYMTYYGIINTDTMEAIIDDDSTEYYIVKTENVTDSNTLKLIGCDSAVIVHFYKPCRNIYFNTIYTNDGKSGLRTYYDPYKNVVWCTEIYNPEDSSIICLEEWQKEHIKKDSI